MVIIMNHLLIPRKAALISLTLFRTRGKSPKISLFLPEPERREALRVSWEGGGLRANGVFKGELKT